MPIDNVCKICRRAGVKLFLKGEKCITVKCPLTRRTYPPGQHGPSKRSPKISGFGLQLKEKQKIRASYGLTEASFRRYVKSALHGPGNTQEKLYRLLESRLDNVIYRAGLAPSRPAAKQLISHGKVMVDSKKVRVASYPVAVGQKIILQNKPPKLYIAEIPSWLGVDKKSLDVTITALPTFDQASSDYNFDLVIEYYAR